MLDNEGIFWGGDLSMSTPYPHAQMHKVYVTYYTLVGRPTSQASMTVYYQQSGGGKKHISGPLPKVTLCETLPWTTAKEISFSRRKTKDAIFNPLNHFSNQLIVFLFAFFHKQNVI